MGRACKRRLNLTISDCLMLLVGFALSAWLLRIVLFDVNGGTVLATPDRLVDWAFCLTVVLVGPSIVGPFIFAYQWYARRRSDLIVGERLWCWAGLGSLITATGLITDLPYDSTLWCFVIWITIVYPVISGCAVIWALYAQQFAPDRCRWSHLTGFGIVSLQAIAGSLLMC